MTGLVLGQDVLGSAEPAPRRARRRLAVALVGGAALAIGGGAVAVAALLSGGGAQPEDVLPGDAFAMVKLDLDPAAGQKVAVYRLAERFPSTAGRVSGSDDVKDELLSALLSNDEVDWARDLEPWVGDRVALAAVPGAAAPEPLAAIAVTDRAEAERALPRLLAQAGEGAFAFSERADYVLVGSSQAVVDAAAAAQDVLADDPSWRRGVDALDGDQIVTAWADLEALYASLPQEDLAAAEGLYGLEALEVTGTVALGLHAAADHVELVGRSLDITVPPGVDASVGTGRGSGLVQDLPADTVAALSVTNLGPGLASAFDALYGEGDPLGILSAAEGFGVRLPDDAAAVLGEDTVVALLGEESAVLRTRTPDVAAAHATAERLAAALTGGGDAAQLLRLLGDGLAVATTPEGLDAVSAGDGGLGGSEVFRTAVPDADSAGTVGFVDVVRALAMSGEDLGAAAGDVEQLQAVGLSSTGDARSATLRLRVTVR